MKKFVALLLTLVLTFSLAACGAEGGVKDDEAAGPGSFKAIPHRKVGAILPEVI